MDCSIKSCLAGMAIVIGLVTTISNTTDASAGDPFQDYRIAASIKALKDGKFASAAYGFKRAVRSETDQERKAQLLVNLCTAERLNGHFDRALTACSSALQITPSLWQAELNIAFLHEDNDEPDRALASFERAHDLRRREAPTGPMPTLIADGLKRLRPQLANALN